MQEQELKQGMRVWFVHCPPNAEPYVDSGELTDAQYFCIDPNTGKKLWPVTTTYTKKKMILTLDEMLATEEEAGKAVMSYAERRAT